VPSEIERLSIPVVDGAESLLDDLDQVFRSGRQVTTILDEQDRKILIKVGLSSKEIEVLNHAWRRLMNRRHRTPSIEEEIG
jgi:hypothetical protein